MEYWKTANIPGPVPTPEVLKMWGGDIHLFPNYLMLRCTPTPSPTACAPTTTTPSGAASRSGR